MGNTQQFSLVEKWNEEFKDINSTVEITDIIELRSNKCISLLSIGICRPIRGSAEIFIEITRIKGLKKLDDYEDTIPAQYLQQVCMIHLKKDVILEPGYIYQIKVKYSGSESYSYLSMKDTFKKEDHTIQFKKQTNEIDERSDKNIITDIVFKISESKDRSCLSKVVY